MNWLRNKFRCWLGIERNADIIYSHEKDIAILNGTIKNLVNIGIDVHFKSPHMILVYSKLNGGQLRHIDADFKDLRELQRFVTELRNRFKTDYTTWDAPPQLKNIFS